MKKIEKIIKWLQKHRCLTAVISGIMFSLPFAFPPLFLLSFFGIALFVIALYGGIPQSSESLFSRRLPIKKPFLRGFLFGLGFFIPLYHWFIALYPFNGFDFTFAQSVFIIIAACVGISIIHSFVYAVVIRLYAFLRPAVAFVPALLAAFWVLAEWAMSLGELGFSWGVTAISQLWLLPQVQTASVFGSYFITLVVISSGAYLGLAAIEREKSKKFLSTAAIVFGANLIFGTVLYFIPTSTNGELDSAILQANISSSEKWENEGKASEEAYFALLEEAVEKYDSDIIVMPESAIPLNYSISSAIKEKLQTVSTQEDVIIVLGALTKDGDGIYNSLVAIYPDGSESNVYNKRSLAPFGEFMPYKDFFENTFPFIKELNLSASSISFGKGSNLIDTEFGSLGGLICFDSIFQENARESVKDGAELLVLATNDSWYKDTAGVRQHADFARLRAIENGRYMVRSANTGISMFIDSKGRIIKSLDALEMGIIESEVKTSNSLTLYTKFGDTALYLAFVIIIFGFINRIYGLIKHKNKQ